MIADETGRVKMSCELFCSIKVRHDQILPFANKFECWTNAINILSINP